MVLKNDVENSSALFCSVWFHFYINILSLFCVHFTGGVLVSGAEIDKGWEDKTDNDNFTADFLVPIPP